MVAVILVIFAFVVVYGDDESESSSNSLFDYSAVYECAEGKVFAVGFSEGEAIVVLDNDQSFVLGNATSASGTKYADAGNHVVFWTKDYGAYVEENGEMTYQDCVFREAGKVMTEQETTR